MSCLITLVGFKTLAAEDEEGTDRARDDRKEEEEGGEGGGRTAPVSPTLAPPATAATVRDDGRRPAVDDHAGPELSVPPDAGDAVGLGGIAGAAAAAVGGSGPLPGGLLASGAPTGTGVVPECKEGGSTCVLAAAAVGSVGMPLVGGAAEGGEEEAAPAPAAAPAVTAVAAVVVWRQTGQKAPGFASH